MTGLTAEDLLPLILTEEDVSSAKRLNEVFRELEANPDLAWSILTRLATRPEADARMWAAAIGADLFGQRYSQVLLRMLRDRDPDVRNMALTELTKHDPATVGAARSTLLEMLSNERDEMNAIQLLHVLGGQRDAAAVDEIRKWAATPGRWPLSQRRAEVTVLYIEEGAEGILARIREHKDHDLMLELMIAARSWTPRQDAIAAVRAGLERADDARCRELYQKSLVALRDLPES